MPAYLACPVNGGRHATVLVVPEIFGMHEYQKDICRRLALRGYTGVTLDPYFRLGELARMTEIREVVGLANRLEDTRMLADLDALVGFISAHPRVNAARMGITGMCRGGRTVWMYAAHSKQMKAGVSWYGGLNPMPPAMPRTPIDVAGALNMPVLGLYGGADAGIPVALVARMQEALKAGSQASRASRFVLYKDMPHAFHADYRPSYRKEAAEDGWQQMLAWFKEHGVA
jgi:carboxymethylenebutenolidase